jgi:hypothetical protein
MGKWSDWIRRLFGAEKAPPEEYLDVSAQEGPSSPQPPFEKKRSWLTKWTPGAQRERQIAWLQAGYTETLTLIRGINAHLERQEDIQHKLVAALEQLPSSFESLKSLGKAAEQQVEALALLRDQLARSSDHDQKLVASMENFNKTLGLLDETARASGRTVAELVQQAREEDRLVHELVQRSEKRMTIITSLFVGALVFMMAAAGYTLFTLRAESIRGQAKTNVAPPMQTVATPLENQPTAPSETPAAVAPEPAPATISELPTTAATAPLDAATDTVTTTNASESEPAQSPSIKGDADSVLTKPHKSRRSWWRKRPHESVARPEVLPASDAEEVISQ